MTRIITLLLLLLTAQQSFASHSAGGEITYTCLGPNQYQVTLQFYRDCEGIAAGGTQTLSYNSATCGVNGNLQLIQVGPPVDITPTCSSAQSTCSGGSIQGIEQYTYQGTLTLPPGCGADWLLSWSVCCRNDLINTLNTANNQSMYVNATLNNTLAICNSSPVFNNAPSSIVCINQPVVYNHGVSDADGDSLFFSLGPCLQGAAQNVVYNAGFNGTTPLTTLAGVSISPNTGAISFTPTSQQVGVICVRVQEYRNGVLIGTINRDMEFSVIACTNTPPVATGVNGSSNTLPINFQTNTCANTQICFTINGSDANGNNVTMTWNNEIPSGSFVVTNNGSANPSAQFCWTPTPSDVGQNVFTVNLEDNACPIVGSSTYTYTINVTSNPNAPVNAGPDQVICAGATALLNATTASPNGVSYSWTPNIGLSSPNTATTNASPTSTSAYTVSLLYNDGCISTDYLLVTVAPSPSASISPSAITACSGSTVTLTGSTNNTGMNFEWFNSSMASLGSGVISGPNSTIVVSVPAAPGSYTYTLRITNPLTGCFEEATSVVTVGAPPPLNVCNVIYVSTTGITTAAGSQAAPTTLAEGLIRGACNGAILKLATGTYNITSPLTIPSYITIEGGFQQASAWTKISTPGATTINRTTANPEGAVNAQRLVAFYGNGATGFRFQDVTITTAAANQPGMSTYGLHLTTCSNYNIVRTQVLPGDAANGSPGNTGSTGIAGRNGGNGSAGDIDDQEDAGGGGGGGGGGGTTLGNAGGNASGNFNSANNCTVTGGIGGVGGATAGSGGNGTGDTNGCGCCNGGTQAAAGGTSTISRSGGGGGGGGNGGCEDGGGGNGGLGGGVTGIFGTNAVGGAGGSEGNDGANGGIGTAGLAGAVGGTGPAGNHGGGFWVPGVQGGTGGDGTGGRGGRGGGGGGGQGCTFCVDGCGSGGGGGGGGGQGGAGGTGGRGGGSSFGVYLLNNGATGNIAQSIVVGGTAGAGGAGGPGGSGGPGGTGGLGSPYGGSEVGGGGNGGSGGAGGVGGAGGDGQAGQSISVFLASGTALATNQSTFNLVGQPTITASDIACTNTNLNFTSVAPAAWNFGVGASPATAGASSPVSSQYVSLGRKDIQMGANAYLGFSNIILDNTTGPLIGTSAPIVNNQYKICAGEFVNFSALNGGLGYNYQWNLGGGAAPNTYNGTTFENLSGIQFNTPGVYTISLNYITNCCGLSPTGTLVLHVEEIPALVLSAPTTSFCAGSTTGAELTLFGMTPGGNVLWTPSSGLDRTDSVVVIATPTSTTTYFATLTDSSGLCAANSNVTVTVNQVNLTTSSTNFICNNDGSATVVASGGSGSYSYLWDDGLAQTTATATNLPTGTYTVLVTDNITSCTNTATVNVVPAPGALAAYMSNVTPVTCNGDATGSITASIIGGTAPFTYVWSPVGGINITAATSQTINTLSSGNYTVTVSDNSGCTSTASGFVSQPDSLTITIDSVSNPSCVGALDGYIELGVEGGTPPYNFLWDTGAPTNPATGFGIGVYEVYITDANFCGGFPIPNVSYTFTAPPAVYDTIYDTICQFEAYTFPSGNIASPLTDTTNSDLFTSSLGCDSLVTFFINVKPVFTQNVNTTICQGQTLTVNGMTYTNAGLYNDTVSYVVSGCDSLLFVIDLQIDSFVVQSIDTTICQGQSLTVNGVTYNTTGVYNDTASHAISGCDSVQYVIDLSIDSFVVQAIDTTICQGQILNVNGVTYDATGLYNDTARYVLSDCDSILFIIDLQVDSFVVQNIDTTICQGQTLTVNGSTYNSTGLYNDTLYHALSGCDSIQYVIDLQIDSFVVENIDTTICQGESLTVNGVTYTATGLYNDTASYAISGCDSIQFVIDLQIDSFIIQNIDTTICQGQSLTVNGNTYTSSGIYNSTQTYATSGCDSIQFVVNLQIDSFTVQNITATIIQGDSLTVNGVSYSVAGIYNDTAYYAANGCDSVQYIIDLSVDSFAIVNIDTAICQGQTLTVNGTTYTNTGIYNDTVYYTLSGGDSIQYVINLQVDSFIVQNIDTTLCQGQSLTVNGITYIAAGLYSDTARYALSGCDSILFTVDLAIDSFVIVNIDTTLCQGQTITVNGTTYNSTGLYNDTISHVLSGCDSIQFVIDLQLDSFVVQNIDTTLCQGQALTVNGVTYTSSGIYNDTARHALSNCDSVQFVINLAIDSFLVESIDTTLCQGQTLTVNGVTYTATGIYNDTARYAASNCDSIQYVIDLQIDSVLVSVIDATICDGDFITVNGVNYSTNVTNVLDTISYALSGCDSVLYDITVTVSPLDALNIDTTICEGQTYTFNGNTYTTSGVYYDTLYGIDTTIAKIDASPSLPVVSSTEISYGSWGPALYSAYNAGGAALPDASPNGFTFDSLANPFWTGNGIPANSIVNTLGFWDPAVPFFQWYGASFSINAPTTSTYYVMLASDNIFRFSLDGSVLILSDEAQMNAAGNPTAPANGIAFLRMHIYPVVLTQGCHTITIEGNNFNGPGMFSGAVLDNTAAEIAAATSNADLNYIFSTATATSFSNGAPTFVCPPNSFALGGSDCDSCRLLICDTIVTINLAIDSFTIETIDTTLCQGQTLTVNGVTYTATGIYNDTARYAASNCDSIQYVIDLQIDSVLVSVIDATICDGDFITVNGVNYSTNVSNVLDTLRYALSGCDSVQYDITVTVNPLDVLNIDTTICEGQTYSFNGNTYTTSGVYYDTLYGIDTIIAKVDVSPSLPVTPSTNVSYGSQGPALYSAYNFGGAALPDASPNGFTFDSLANPFWTGNGVIANSIANTIGYWDAAVPDGQWFGASFSINVPATSTYYIMLAADNNFRFSLDGTTLITSNEAQINAAGNPTAPAQGIAFLRLHIYPLVLTQGCHIITIEGNNDGGPGMFSGAVLDNTSAEIMAATSNADLNYIFSTGTASSFSNGAPTFVCPPNSFALGGSDCDSCRLLICDTIVTINLAIDSFTIETVDTTLCQGQTLTVNGVTYTVSGLYNDTARYTASNCDSIQYVINLAIDSFVVQNIDTTICQGQSLLVNGITYTVSGLYNDTARYTASNCDSIQFVINLAIDSFVVQNIDTTICQGQTLLVNGLTYTASGLYNDTARYTASNCDSIQFVIDLQIDSFVVQNIDTTICQGQTLFVNGVTYTASGLYNDTARYSASNCDSIQYVINLAIDSFVVQNIDTTLCQGQTLIVNGVTYTASGLYNDTARYAASNCDSIQYVIDLSIDSFVVQNIDTTICQGQTLLVNGVTYSVSGLYNDTARYAASNCDSIQFVINLAIDSFLVQNIDTTLCQGQTLLVNGVTYTASGLYNDTARYSSSNCDSIQFVIDLSIDSFVVQNIDTTICQGQTLLVNGVTYTANGLYNDTARYSTSNCDSIQFVIDLHIDSFVVQNIDTTICQGQTLTVNGLTYTASGLYNDTASYSASNCDSIQFVIDLQIDSFLIVPIDTTICQGQSLTVNGVTYTIVGNYSDTAQHVLSGCDSIQYVINLQIDSFETTNVDTLICQGDSIVVNGVAYFATGIYADSTFYAVSGCVEHIYNVDLTVAPLPLVQATSSDIDSAVCINNSISLIGTGTAGNVYTWNNGALNNVAFNPPLGQTNYVVTALDANGCVNTDSIMITGHPIFKDSIFVSICEDENYILADGVSVNTEGLYAVNLPTQNGCDSIILTYVNVNLLGIFTPLEDQAICDGFIQELSLDAQNMTSIEWFVNDGSGNQTLVGNPNYLNATGDPLSFNIDLNLHQNIYSVVMIDECGNAYNSSMTLEVYEPHNVANPLADTSFCAHEIGAITVDYNGQDYVWNTGDFGETILPTISGDYIVEFVENLTNCSMSDTIGITIEDCIGNCVVLAPTGFTPNASGANDIFRVVTTCDEGFSSFYFAIYNRWGELVYATDDWREGWDGTIKGKNAEIGTFTFYVEYTKELTNKNEILRGNVTLIR